jgi:hypothetical protein
VSGAGPFLENQFTSQRCKIVRVVSNSRENRCMIESHVPSIRSSASDSCLELVQSLPVDRLELILVQHLPVELRVSHHGLELVSRVDRSYAGRRTGQNEIPLLPSQSWLLNLIWPAYAARWQESELTSSFMMPETNEIRCGTSKIMSFAVPLCFTLPLMEKCRPTLAMSAILDLGMNGLHQLA